MLYLSFAEWKGGADGGMLLLSWLWWVEDELSVLDTGPLELLDPNG